jgi:hypothetical protein
MDGVEAAIGSMQRVLRGLASLWVDQMARMLNRGGEILFCLG